MTHDEARAIIREVLSTDCFFVAPGAGLRIEYRPTDDVPWEIFRGHLLDHTQTRLRKTFESWEVIFEPPDRSASAAIISVKLDLPAKRIYVVRNILVYAWEAYETAPNVVGTREAKRWMCELVGTVELAETVTAEQLGRRVSRCVFLAVVGTSRLPITSLESPLPAFSLGQIGYVAHPAIESRLRPRAHPRDLTERAMDDTATRPMADPRDFIEQGLTRELSSLERAKLLETVLRSSAADDVPSLAELFVERWRAIGAPVAEISMLVRIIFNHAALSPYTRFVDNLVRMLVHLARRELLQLGEAIDVLSYLLRHLARHLTAFDLVTFHNLGANYPDALLLDTLLKAYISIIEAHAEEFTDYRQATARLLHQRRVRRRALRQAWLLRKQYEGHPVPDAPTSPGENLRVLPGPFVRVPEEQILQPGQRRRRLFAAEPADQLLPASARRILQQGTDDLEGFDELRELGMASYLDRPLGIFKQPGEVDRTPLVSYEAFSRKLADGRLQDLHRWGLVPTQGRYQWLVRRLHEELRIAGFPVAKLESTERPGVVALEDAHRGASDFVFLRTTQQSLTELLACYDFGPLRDRVRGVADWLFSAKQVLWIRTAGWPIQQTARPFLAAFRADMQKRIELGLGQKDDGPVRYVEADGIEYLQHGLRVLRVSAEDGCDGLYDWTDDDVRLPPYLPGKYSPGKYGTASGPRMSSSATRA